MPDFDPFSAMVVDEPTALEMAQARAAALRKQNYLGLMGSLAHDRYAAQSGQALMQQAQQGQTQLGELPGERLKMAMQRQTMQQQGPQEALGGLSPAVAEAKAKLESVPRFTSVYPGSRMYSVRTGLPAEGPGGEQAPDIVKQTADGIQNGTAPPDMKGLGKLRVPVQAELSTRGFNLAQANLDWQATQKHLSTLNSGSQERLNQAINFVSDTIPVIRQLYGEWQQLAGQSGYKIINKATLAAMKQLPGRAGAVAQALDTQINDFGAELGTVYKGGGTSTDKSLGMAASNLQADWNPETFNKALDLAEKNIAIRKNSVTHSGARGTSGANPYAPPAAPDAVAAPAAKKKVYNPATGQIEEK